MKHLTLMFSIFVSPALDQFQFIDKLGAGQELWCHTYGRALCRGTHDSTASYKLQARHSISLFPLHTTALQKGAGYILFLIPRCLKNSKNIYQ